jgi:D-inositol-3-phosphate glycosyltransferase
MRIAMLSYHTCPLATLGGKDTGGMNVYVHELTRELGRSGIGVDVFTRSQDEHVPHVLHDLGYGNRVVHIPAGPESPLAKVGLEEYLGEFSQGVADFTASKQLKYDLIHSHYWLSGLSGLWLRQRWGTPVIHMFHTLALMKNRVARSPAEVASAGRLDGEQRMLREADRIVAATPAEFAQIQWLYHGDTDKVVIIPPGVDTTHFYPIMKDEAREFVGIEAEKRILLYVGRIEPLKGLDTLLEAMASLRAKRVLKDDCACLAIIGGDPDGEGTDQEMQRLQSLQESLGLRQMINAIRPLSSITTRLLRRSSFLHTMNHLDWWHWKRWPAARRWSPPKRADWLTWSKMGKPASMCRLGMQRRWPSACKCSCRMESLAGALAGRRPNMPGNMPGR